ncbi:hypothetical protein THAOC_02079 [Thalassiosira oceanica]|uniref:Uncharacterized protein n=1 Tax=Thalassiosira oceanica TaxID=159749 RepID=K0TMF9_THAOC|nr:hypothetical protein THAOC_02079 [Thalassiosira oceanica]|eukprot:EJK76176.1 hypothetical protein THAOC_02079 [Thalassiosira oceanica]
MKRDIMICGMSAQDPLTQQDQYLRAGILKLQDTSRYHDPVVQPGHDTLPHQDLTRREGIVEVNWCCPRSIADDVGPCAELPRRIRRDDGEDEVISVHSSGGSQDSREAAREGFQSQLEGFHIEGEGGENDWETSAAVQATISESIRQQQELHGGIHAAVHAAAAPSPDRLRTADDGEIAGLAREARNAWIEDAQRRRRIASRRECIGAAADPSGYSAAQLRNFLEGSRLNARVGRIGKLAERMREEQAGRPLKRLRRGRGSDGGEDDEDAGVINCAGDRRATSGPSMRALFGEDDSDDDGGASGGGGGFLPATNQDGLSEKAAGLSGAIENRQRRERRRRA